MTIDYLEQVKQRLSSPSTNGYFNDIMGKLQGKPPDPYQDEIGRLIASKKYTPEQIHGAIDAHPDIQDKQKYKSLVAKTPFGEFGASGKQFEQ